MATDKYEVLTVINLKQLPTRLTKALKYGFWERWLLFFVIVFRVDVNAFTMTYYKLYMQSKGHLTLILYCTSWVARITKADFNVHFWSRVENVYKMQIVSKCYNRYKI